MLDCSTCKNLPVSKDDVHPIISVNTFSFQRKHGKSFDVTFTILYVDLFFLVTGWSGFMFKLIPQLRVNSYCSFPQKSHKMVCQVIEI